MDAVWGELLLKTILETQTLNETLTSSFQVFYSYIQLCMQIPDGASVKFCSGTNGE